MSSPEEIPDELWKHPTLKKAEHKKAPKFCKKDCKDKLCMFNLTLIVCVDSYQ